MYSNRRLISDRLNYAIAVREKVAKKFEDLKGQSTYLNLKVGVLLDEVRKIKTELDSEQN